MMNNLKKPKYRIGDKVRVLLSTVVMGVTIEGARIGVVKSVDYIIGSDKGITYKYIIAKDLETTQNHGNHTEEELFPVSTYSEHDKEMLLKFVDYVNINGGRAHKDDVLFFMKDIDNE